MKKRIVLLSGGSGGHVFPSIAISEELLKKKIDHVFLTDERCEKIIKNHNVEYKVIQSSKFSKKLIDFPMIFFKTLYGFIQSFFFLINKKPKCIIAFGGYTCFPSLVAAKLLKIPIYVHEQNAVMGKANRFYSKFAVKTILGFKETKYSSDNTIHLGTPVRKSFKKKIINYKSSNIRILVLGGSQGAQIFSEILPKIISNFKKEDLKNIFLVQQSRKGDISELTKFYKKINIKFIIKSFFSNIPEEMNKANIVISRCGASTLSEISVCSKPSILFPLPSAKDNHQYENALAFSKNNKCLIFDENRVDVNKITVAINEFIFKPSDSNNSKKLQSSSEKIIQLLEN